MSIYVHFYTDMWVIVNFAIQFNRDFLFQNQNNGNDRWSKSEPYREKHSKFQDSYGHWNFKLNCLTGLFYRVFKTIL